MKTHPLITAALLCFGLNSLQAQYGTLAYPHVNEFLTSAKTTDVNTTGFVMAGVLPTASGSQNDFVIQKVDANGAFSAGTFVNEYLITCQPNCSGAPTSPHKCTAVNIIEIAPYTLSNENYAVAGVFDAGIFFATIDAAGSPVVTQFWPLPAGSQLGKPTVVRTANNFYICGSYNSSSYIIQTDNFGNPGWNWLYNNMLIEIRDMIASPFNNNELVAVGLCEYNLFQADDAFFLKIDANTGGVNQFVVYNDGNDGDEWFNSVQPANSSAFPPGFIIGGRLVSPNVPPYQGYTPWMMRVDQNGNTMWSTLIAHNYEIVDVFERYNPVASPPKYEYYGLSRHNASATSSDLRIWKFDEMGNPVASPNYFEYNIGSIVASPDFTEPQLDFVGDGSVVNDGMVAWGTYRSINNFALIKSYYNGVNGCEIRSDMTTTPGPGVFGQPPLTSVNFITPCPNFGLTPAVLSGSATAPCNWSNPSNGSNSRLMQATGINSLSNNESLLSVYPNPSNGMLTISLANQPAKAQIKLMSATGQLVRSYELSKTQIDAQQMQLDLKELNVNAGIYFVSIIADGKTQTQKVVYQK